MASSSLLKASSLEPLFASAIRSSALYGESGTLPSFSSTIDRAIDTAGPQIVAFSMAFGSCLRLTFMPFITLSAQARESSRYLGESNMASAMPSSKASSGVRTRFCLSGFSIMTLRAFLIPIKLGSRYAPPQPGMSPMKTSGNATAGAVLLIVR